MFNPAIGRSDYPSTSGARMQSSGLQSETTLPDQAVLNSELIIEGLPSVIARLTSSISTLNQQIRELEQNGESIDGQLDTLREQRNELITDFTGNPSASSYDVDVVGWAQSRGTTYNYEAAQLNKSREFQNLHRPADSQIPYVNEVRELPWETEAVNNRVDNLIAKDGLSPDAAIAIAMTERPTNSGSSGIFSSFNPATVEGGWEDNFASRVTKSATEIEAWATNQPASATVNLGDGGADIDVTIVGDELIVFDKDTNTALGIFDPAEFARIVIVGGSGDDTINVRASVTTNLTLVGGAGDDTIIGGNGGNIIIGGDGNDNLEGGSSEDLIIGGAGRDSVYGAGGADTISGGTEGDSLYGGSGEDLIIGNGGDDYIDGGKGNDMLRGGLGNDTISGGFGNDNLRGEAGSDTLIGASGLDRYADAMTGDTVIAEHFEGFSANGATVSRIRIDNNAGGDSVHIASRFRDSRFTDRVEDDLQTLRSLETGQAMLNALDGEFARAGHTTTIEEFDEENGEARIRGNNSKVWLQDDGSRSKGQSGEISYNPHFNTSSNAAPTVPIVVLFHEFAHTYDFASGQLLRGTNDAVASTDPNFGTNLRELVAAGIAIDHDNDASTPDQLLNEAGHAFELTENGIRQELGVPERTIY